MRSYGQARVRHYTRMHSGTNGVAKTVLGVGILAAVGYGLYKLFDWLFTESDQQLLSRCEYAAQRVHDECDNLIMFFSHHAIIPTTLNAKKNCIESLHEPFLNQCQELFTAKKQLVKDRIYILDRYISDLCSVQSSLTNRITQLQARNKSSVHIYQMEKLHEKVVVLLETVEFIRSYLNYHVSYFEIAQLYTQLVSKYEPMLSVLSQYGTSSTQFAQALSITIMSTAAQSGDTFAYMHYAQDLSNDLERIKRLYNDLPYNYSNIASNTRILLQNLTVIYQTIIVDSKYHQELRDYERVCLEKQRIEIEQSKAYAAHMQANAARVQAEAMQHQAQELSAQNYLHAQQLQVDQQRNALLHTQNYLSAVTAMQKPEVYVYM